MVKLNKIYTKTGDDGTTGLVDGSRVAKYSSRVAAYGEVDEANSSIGVLRLQTAKNQSVDKALSMIQNDLFDLGADLATPIKPQNIDSALRISPAQVTKLEQMIDDLNQHLLPLTSFILPGGSAASVQAHMARTIVRRAERLGYALNEAEPVNPFALQYMNRLSDYLFVLARHLNNNGKDDVLWVPGENR